ncbi:MAG: Nif3-like dinuclear metal center hexameric protein, partial [Akkermansia sp.]|nr:Nif3-like dinuclear metal center hexameric protein [Akkermansia sp.]
MTPLQHITHLLDTTLRIREIKDAPVALNGLQVENNGQVTKVALAVDGSQKTIEDAIAAGADLLILHHGIYWCGLRPMTDWFKKKIETCLQHNLAVYGAHLPLDLHPELGNNAGIAQGLTLGDQRLYPIPGFYGYTRKDISTAAGTLVLVVKFP